MNFLFLKGYFDCTSRRPLIRGRPRQVSALRHHHLPVHNPCYAAVSQTLQTDTNSAASLTHPRKPGSAHPNILRSTQGKGRIIPLRNYAHPCHDAAPFPPASTRKRADGKAKQLISARILLKASLAPSAHIFWQPELPKLEGNSSDSWSFLRPLHS